MERIACIVNTRSGAGRGQRLAEELKGAAKTLGLELRLVPCVTALDSEEMTQVCQSDRLLIAGGDGSISTLLPNLIETQPAIGIIPLGTGNDLARELGVFKAISRASAKDLLSFYLKAEKRRVAVWKFSYGADPRRERLFVNYLSFGFDGRVVAEYDKLRESSRWTGRLGPWGNRSLFFRAGLRALSGGRVPCGLIAAADQQISHTCSGERTIIFANIRSIMGLGISNQVGSPFDNKIEAVRVPSVFNYLGMTARGRLFSSGECLGNSGGWEIRDLEPTTSFQIDGESGEQVGSAACTIEPAGTLKLLGRF